MYCVYKYFKIIQIVVLLKPIKKLITFNKFLNKISVGYAIKNTFKINCFKKIFKTKFFDKFEIFFKF